MMKYFRRRGFAHCDAALNGWFPWGKLFERLNGKETLFSDELEAAKKVSAFQIISEFLPRHGNHRDRDYRSAGLGSFVTFLAHQEK